MSTRRKTTSPASSDGVSAAEPVAATHSCAARVVPIDRVAQVVVTAPRAGAALRRRAAQVASILDARYANAQCALDYQDAFGLTIAVLLSAQTTDAAVNKVTPVLFARWPTPAHLAAAAPEDVAGVIKSIGLYRNKAANCVRTAQMLMSDFAGSVPASMEELTRLPGVGRKSANIILNNAFGIVAGIAVDTHVYRLAQRLGFARKEDNTANKVERRLLGCFDASYWGRLNHQWVLFGREVCTARSPRCPACPLYAASLCPGCHQKQSELK